MKKIHFLGGLIAGAAMGAVAGVLLAPKSGKETRADIKKAYDNLAQEIADKVVSIRELTKEKYSHIVDKAVSEYARVHALTQEQIDLVKSKLKSQWDTDTKKKS